MSQEATNKPPSAWHTDSKAAPAGHHDEWCISRCRGHKGASDRRWGLSNRADFRAATRTGRWLGLRPTSASRGARFTSAASRTVKTMEHWTEIAEMELS